MTSVPLFGMLPGGPEMMIILFLVVLLFGANKIPELARASGKALGEFKRGREEIESDIRSAVEADEPEGEGERVRESPETVVAR